LEREPKEEKGREEKEKEIEGGKRRRKREGGERKEGKEGGGREGKGEEKGEGKNNLFIFREKIIIFIPKRRRDSLKIVEPTSPS
jgi:hypothetical protein